MGDLEKSEKEREKAVLARGLLEDTLKASRESQSKVEELINKLQEDIRHERSERIKESRKRDEVEKKYMDQMKKYQDNVKEMQESHRIEMEKMEKQVDENHTRKQELIR